MADRYWVGGTGNWSDDTNHWATSSGGSPGGGNLPTAADNVHFDSNSSAANAAYTVTLNTAVAKVCRDFNMAGPGGGNKVTWAGTQSITISGSMNLSGGTAGITRTYSGAIKFDATSTGKTITTNGIALSNQVDFNGSGGEWTLQDAFSNSGTILHRDGALIANSYTVTCVTYSSLFCAVGTTLDISGSTFACTSGGSFTTGADLTLVVNTVTLNTFESFGGFAGAGSGKTFNDVVFGSAGGNPWLNSYRNATWVPTGAATVSCVGNFVVTGTLTATGNSPSARVLFSSDISGTARTITAGTVTLTDVDFQDIVGAGAATWSGTRVGNCKGNSGITFTAPANKYWVGNSANWTSTSWALTSGGSAAANNYPLPQDNCIFDANSFSANGQTITASPSVRMPSLDFSSITKTGIVLSAISGPSYIFGNVTLSTSMTVSSSTTSFVFSGRSTQTFTSAGASWGAPLVLDSIGGVLQLADAMDMSSKSFTLTNGTLNTNGQSASMASFVTGTGTKTLTLGASILTLAGTGTVLNNAQNTNLTVTASSGTFKITDATAAIKTIAAGNRDWNGASIWLTGAGSGAFQFTGSPTFNDLRCDTPPHTIEFTAGTTTTFSTWHVSGTAGNLITIGSITAANHTLLKSGGGVISVDYLSVSRSTATPGSTWYAGSHSTDGGNNSGWSFFSFFVDGVVDARVFQDGTAESMP